MPANAEGGARFGDPGLDDTLEEMRAEMRRFGQAEVAPHAHGWHLAQRATSRCAVVERHGRAGRVRPDHPRGVRRPRAWARTRHVRRVRGVVAAAYIGVGSLGTRSEIAAELILCGGTRRAEGALAADASPSGEVLPTGRCSPSRTPARTSRSLRTRARARRRQSSAIDRRQDLDHPSRRAPT
jgi:(2S)-methylsuccinyl-CoA dehydrogenase